MRTQKQIERAIHSLAAFGLTLPDDYTLAELCGDVMIARGIDGARLDDRGAALESLIRDLNKGLGVSEGVGLEKYLYDSAEHGALLHEVLENGL